MKITLLPLLIKTVISKKKKLKILSDSIKFSQVSVTDNKLNFIVNVEEHIIDLLEVISENIYKNLKLRGSRFGIFYGLCKVHKQSVKNCPPCKLRSQIFI